MKLPRSTFHWSHLVLATAAFGCTAALAGAGAPAKESGGVLVGDKDMTLYTFDKDEKDSGKSVCNGQCATNWPPLMAKDSDKPTGDLTVVTRDDGKKQWAYKGKPLYYWIKDTKAGDKTGESVPNWKLAKP